MAGRKRLQSKPEVEADARPAAWLTFVERHSIVLAVALIVIASARIAATYTVFNHTADEPAHIACGMEWLAEGVYKWEPQHPPLARVATAIGPFLRGIRPQNTPRNRQFAMFYEGAAILYHGDQYDRTLSTARMGVLPFFWLACVVVYLWGARYFSRAVGVAALFVFSFLPPILAHGGLATTDMALTATMGASFLAGMIWLARPTLAHAAIFGLATGLMTISKFSALAFFPVSCGLALGWFWYRERPGWEAVRARLAPFGLAVLVGVLVIAAGYRFSFHEFFAGIQQLREHNAAGHDGYLLGERSTQGFWLFFPVALGVKTPIAVLIAAGVAIALALRKTDRVWIPIAFSAGILLVGLFSRIAIGVRHILPIYIGIALLAAIGAMRLPKWTAAALAVWFIGASLLSHPDYLPYFNEIAGSEPEKILADSDLDWGQDLKRLSTRLKELGATEVAFPKYIAADLEKHGFPRVRPVPKMNPAPGWNAVGVGLWKESRLVIWPDFVKPNERVGKSILLWYFPPSGQ